MTARIPSSPKRLDQELRFFNDSKSLVCIGLLKHGNSVDRQMTDRQSRKTVLQKSKGACASVRIETARESHVKTEFVHHIWVAPSIEIVALTGRQFLWLSARVIRWCQRCAKGFEGAHAVGG